MALLFDFEGAGVTSVPNETAICWDERKIDWREFGENFLKRAAQFGVVNGIKNL